MLQNILDKIENWLANKAAKIFVAAQANTRKAEIRARVYRASEGRWHDLGTVSKTDVALMKLKSLKQIIKDLWT